MKKNLKKTAPSKNHPVKTNQLAFSKHLQELRLRFFVWFVFFIIGSVIGYWLYPALFKLLVAPLHKPLYYTSPTGGFNAVFNLSIFFGFVMTIPILLYQIAKFVEPSFGNKSIKSLANYIMVSIILACLGLVLAYYLVLPAALQFLNKFGGDNLTAIISTQDYFSFVTKYLMSFALLFQLPLLMYGIDKYKPLEPKKLMHAFKYVFLFSFIIAAILTPTPDFINQTIMASPIILLYLFSVMMIWLGHSIDNA